MQTQTETASTPESWQRAIEASSPALRIARIVNVPADSEGWVDTGVTVQAGESLSLLACGTAHPAGAEEVRFDPSLLLCRRIRGAQAFDKLPASCDSFTADSSGSLELVVQFPGAWNDPAGTLAADWPRNGATGGFSVAVLVWKASADEGLALFAASDDSGFGNQALQRVLDPAVLPQGWSPLWRVGSSEVYRQTAGDTWPARIRCNCHGDGGILKYPVDIPLDASTRLDWRWRVTALPSAVAEDSTPTHDYLSIAVEFDNGLDLTYMWSVSLPVGYAFKCPFPWWDKRETHQVVRSGAADMGRWQDESQPILADYEKAIGGPAPTRIVGVWLIAVSVFQRKPGNCEYQAIRLSGTQGTLTVGPT